MTIRPLIHDPTYVEYCTVIGVASGAVQTAIPFAPGLTNLIGKFGEVFQELKNKFAVGANEIYRAFSQRDIFQLLKAISFNVTRLFKTVLTFTNLIPKGLFRVFEKLHETKVFQKLKAGTMKVDEVLNQYPLLKKLAGPAVAGFLLWVWMSESFVGNPAFDLDLSLVLAALQGKFTIYELFVSPQGLAMLAMLATGMFTGVGVAWLGDSTANLILALVYTGLKKAKAGKYADSIKKLIPLKRV